MVFPSCRRRISPTCKSFAATQPPKFITQKGCSSVVKISSLSVKTRYSVSVSLTKTFVTFLISYSPVSGFAEYTLSPILISSIGFSPSGILIGVPATKQQVSLISVLKEVLNTLSTTLPVTSIIRPLRQLRLLQYDLYGRRNYWYNNCGYC